MTDTSMLFFRPLQYLNGPQTYFHLGSNGLRNQLKDIHQITFGIWTKLAVTLKAPPETGLLQKGKVTKGGKKSKVLPMNFLLPLQQKL